VLCSGQWRAVAGNILGDSSTLGKLGRRLRRLGELPAGDRWRLAQAAVGLPLNAAGVRLVGFRKWAAYLAQTVGRQRQWTGRRRSGDAGQPASASRPASGLQTAHQTWRLVQWAATYGPYGGNCLSRSLTLWWLLRRQGLESELRIGVSTTGGRFEAHAWIEFQGTVINDQPDVRERFGVFDLPAGSAIPFTP